MSPALVSFLAILLAILIGLAVTATAHRSNTR